MPTRSGLPSTIDGIKRFAKRLKVETGLQHARALDAAAQAAGFSNFTHARRTLASERPQGRDEHPSSHKVRSMNVETFHQRARAAWVAAIHTAVGPNVPSSSIWTRTDQMVRVLTHVMGHNNNHTHLPTGGGVDMLKVRLAAGDPSLLEFHPYDTDDIVYLMKPKQLTLEFIEDAPAESFFYLELQKLKPSGVYPPIEEGRDDNVSRYRQYSEEVVEVGPGQYVSRSGWDEGAYPDGRPLPADARLVVRFLGGAAMPVAKGSLWNGHSPTYDGRHSKMTPVQIRDVIIRSLA
ncbi:MAG: hypothetical protein KL801_15475 [Mesorhizobium sp.]|nr:hypothetical protein [Mesorhizobium sp.]